MELKKLQLLGNKYSKQFIGAIFKRKEYLLTGGAVGTLLTIGVINEVKKRRNTKDERMSTEELEKIGIEPFQVKSFETKSFDI